MSVEAPETVYVSAHANSRATYHTVEHCRYLQRVDRYLEKPFENKPLRAEKCSGCEELE